MAVSAAASPYKTPHHPRQRPCAPPTFKTCHPLPKKPLRQLTNPRLHTETGGAVLPHSAEAPAILAHIAAWHMQQVLHMQGGMCARAVMAIVVHDGVVL